MKKAIIMGNGPSLNTFDFETLKKSDVNTYATNRIAALCQDKDWVPDYYCVFFSMPHQGSKRLFFDKTQGAKQYSSGNLQEGLDAQKDINFVCKNKQTACYIHEWYKYFIEPASNIKFVTPTLWDRFKEFPMGILDDHKAPNKFLWWIATTSLFQLCVHHEVDTIGLIGVDGYNIDIKNNHYKGYKGADPGNMIRSNKKIKRQHDVISEYLNRKNIKVYNLSENSILNHYQKTSFNEFLQL